MAASSRDMPTKVSLALSPKLAAGRQMNAARREPAEVQGPAVQATKQLHARHLLFSHQNTFCHVLSLSLSLEHKHKHI